ILDICQRVEGKEFTPVQDDDDDDTLTFLTDLGYKGPLYKHTNMFMDHMRQPWRTLAIIINKCLSRKTTSNDNLRKSRIDILWGMFYRENVDYPELIWEDFDFQIDHRKEKKSRLSEPKPAKKRTASRRVVKKKVTISADDNIIPDPDVAFELGKSISITKAEEEEAARQVHATHARIVTESVPEPAKKKTSSKSTRSVVIQDTPSAPKSKPAASKLKLKAIPSLTPEEQLAADTMQALKESKNPAKDSQVLEAQVKELVGYQGFPVSPQSSLLPQVKELVLNQQFLLRKSEKEDIDWIGSKEDDEKKDDTDDDKSIDLEMTDDEETDDEVLQNIDAAKENAKKNEEAKDHSKKAELPLTSSSLSVSLGFGDQFLKLSSDTSLIGTSSSVLKVHVFVISEPPVLTPVQETPLAAPVTTLTPPSISTIPPAPLQHSTTPIPSPPITTDAPTITTAVIESNALSAVQQRVAKLEKDVSKLKKIDHFTNALATLKSQVLMTRHENKSSNRNPTNHRLFHALMEALIEDENAMDKRVADTVKDHKRKHDDDDDDKDPPAGPNQDKNTKRRRTKESESSKKPSTTKETPKGKC
ncbi:hypothetical protein Tco_1339547, partial [Tanacetum coccineum]